MNQQIFQAKVKFISTMFELELRKSITERIPLKIYQFIAGLPFVGSPSMKKSADKIAGLHAKLDDMIQIFDFFITG